LLPLLDELRTFDWKEIREKLEELNPVIKVYSASGTSWTTLELLFSNRQSIFTSQI